MADVNRIAQIEMRDDGGDVSGVVVHIVTITHLTRAPVATAVMGNHAKALLEEVQQLRIPIVAAQRPAVMEHNRLRALRTPVFVENRRPVLRGNRAHGDLLNRCEDSVLSNNTGPRCTRRTPPACSTTSASAGSRN